jgi:hypothetical protein
MTRYHLEVLRAEDYVNVRLLGETLIEFIGREAIRKAQQKGVELPSDATVNVMFNGALITVEIFKPSEEVLCTQAKRCGIFAR